MYIWIGPLYAPDENLVLVAVYRSWARTARLRGSGAGLAGSPARHPLGCPSGPRERPNRGPGQSPGLVVSTLTYPNIPLHDVMRATAARHPDRRAITFKDTTWSFAQFDLDSNRLANGLAALGLGAGDRMSLYLPNCPQYELGFYAASKLGAIACPLNPSYRER